MSELKAYRIIQGDTGGFGAPSYKCDIDGNRIEEWPDTCEVYDKFEADKVIAELKADYKEACDRLQTANLIKDEQIAATRHSKRKRCLNKAEWCEERSARYDALQERTGFSWRREIDFYFRWSQRWLELAEKFKEAK